MDVETFDSIFDALADTPAEAANMTACADLLLAIRSLDALVNIAAAAGFRLHNELEDVPAA